MFAVALLAAVLLVGLPGSAAIASTGGASVPEGGSAPPGSPGGTSGPGGAPGSPTGSGPPAGGRSARPTLTGVFCVSRCGPAGQARAGSKIELRGSGLAGVRRVVFLGGRGKADDVLVKVRPASRSLIRLRVPRRALSGPLSARVSRKLGASGLRIAILRSRSRPAPGINGHQGPQGMHVFPVDGPHNYGGSGARFGAPRGGRSHRGHDVFAACGTPMLAAHGGVVKANQYQGLAGYYVVINSRETGFDYVYMHLAAASPLPTGAAVATGQQIGAVGETGNAHGCHLHFELWTAPGWYSGGTAIDPLPSLKAWDRAG